MKTDGDEDSDGRSVGAEKHPRAMDLVKGDDRLLWQDLQVVRESRKQENLSRAERNKQEAKFELMMTEASYLKKLNMLRNHFMMNIQKFIPQVLSQRDYNILFKNILDIRAASAKFLKDLDEKWQEDVMLDGIYEVITKYASNDFKSYLNYCRNMEEMCSHLEKLTRSNQEFQTLLEDLTDRQGKQKLSLNSFLTSPMQRITKFPLLMETILGKINPNSEEYRMCKKAHDAVCKIALECNDMAAEKERTEGMLRLSQQIEFQDNVPAIAIMVKGRFVVAQTDVLYYFFTEKNPSKKKFTLIFLNDLLLVTKKVKTSSDRLMVVSHCPRQQVAVSEVQNRTEQNHHVAVITLNKTTSYVLAFTDNKQWQACLSYISSTPAKSPSTILPTADTVVSPTSPSRRTNSPTPPVSRRTDNSRILLIDSRFDSFSHVLFLLLVLRLAYNFFNCLLTSIFF